MVSDGYKKAFKGMIEEMQDLVLRSIEAWTQAEREQLRRDVIRDLNEGMTATGEWIS